MESNFTELFNEALMAGLDEITSQNLLELADTTGLSVVDVSSGILDIMRSGIPLVEPEIVQPTEQEVFDFLFGGGG